MISTNILILGAFGFIGTNASYYFMQKGANVTRVSSQEKVSDKMLERADVVLNFAGINRTNEISDFNKVNANYSSEIFDFIVSSLQ